MTTTTTTTSTTTTATTTTKNSVTLWENRHVAGPKGHEIQQKERKKTEEKRKMADRIEPSVRRLKWRPPPLDQNSWFGFHPLGRPHRNQCPAASAVALIRTYFRFFFLSSARPSRTKKKTKKNKVFSIVVLLFFSFISAIFFRLIKNAAAKRSKKKVCETRKREKNG